MRYFIADTHFNHENIIKYCNRPFKNSKEMNECIISKWNSIVKQDDTVYHLGDVGFGSTEELKKLVGRLNGTKILIRGNHDFKRGLNGWKEVGFSEVYKKRLVLENLILTHEPIEIEENYINVFGHIHDKPLDERFNKNNHICVSCDVIDYTPITLENIKETNEIINEFDENAFRTMIKEIIVGDYNKDESVNPFALKFILNSDNIGKNTIEQENGINYMEQTLITEMDVNVFFEVFNVQENGYKKKEIIDKIHVKVCSDI